MDNLKEQIAKEIVEYDFTGFNPKWIECANKSHWLNLATKILSIIEQAGYAQLQTGEDGLVKKESRCVKCRAENNGECFDIECTTHSYERGFKDGTVDQKALCDKEKEETVKKVGDKIRKFDKGEGWIELGEADLAYIIKQTLEALNEQNL